MTAEVGRAGDSRPGDAREELHALAEAVEVGAGLPAVARAASRALGASLAVIDRSAIVLAVAAGSSAEESRLLAEGEGVGSIELRVADQPVGRLRFRARDDGPGEGLLRLVAALLALEVERSRSPDWADEAAAADFVRAVASGGLAGPAEALARAAEIGLDLEGGAGVVRVRVQPRRAQEGGDWRARALSLASRAVGSVCPGSVAADDGAELVAIAPASSVAQLGRAAEATRRELEDGLDGFIVVVGHSRHVSAPEDLGRAANEALLALNVAEADGKGMLSFEETGAYRLLLGAMSEDRAELRRFYAETVEPLLAYDEQYETELLHTVEAYLENDGNVAATAGRLFTHRHTVRYRLERIRELSGHDLTSTEGRERLGLGLKAMRVLGIGSPRGPASEPGSAGGKVSRAEG